MKASFHINNFFSPWRFIVRELGCATKRDTYTWATSRKKHPSSQIVALRTVCQETKLYVSENSLCVW